MADSIATIAERVRRARNRSVPLLAIETTDPAETTAGVVLALQPRNDDKPEPPCFSWDCASGLRGVNTPGISLRDKLADPKGEFGGNDVTPGEEGLVRLLGFAATSDLLPHRLVLILSNAHRFANVPEVMQSIWNLRTAYKQNQCMLVLLGPSMQLPAEIQGDVMIFDDPLPARDRLAAIAGTCLKDVGQTADAPTMERLVDSVAGLSAFQSEQVIAMSIEKAGVNLDYAWERKRKQVEQTPGLSIWRGGEKFSDIGGVANAKDFISRILKGRARPHGVVFVDEIEKAMAGAKGDTSGVSQDILGVVLQHMQDSNAAGMVFIGPPGTSKSMVAKAAGNEADVPTIRLDFGAMKGSLVGQSESNVRHALKVINAVTGGSALWIATCNGIAELPPELRRRYTLGTFFFDLPSDEERQDIWKIHTTRYFEKPAKPAQLKAMVAASGGWTGAEIRQACDIMYRCELEFADAAKFVVPVSISAGQQVDSLRSMASGRFLSASSPGLFQKTQSAPATTAGRKITITDD